MRADPSRAARGLRRTTSRQRRQPHLRYVTRHSYPIQVCFMSAGTDAGVSENGMSAGILRRTVDRADQKGRT